MTGARLEASLALVGGEHAFINSTHCKRCLSAYKRDYRSKNGERLRAKDRAYCAANKDRARAYREEHREAIAQNRREYNARSRDKITAYNRQIRKDPVRLADLKARLAAWKQANKPRCAELERRRNARIRGAFGSHTAVEWDAILEKQGRRCAYCRRGGEMTRDHIVPISKGGSDMACNIQALCRPCNSSKQARLIPGTQLSVFDRVPCAS